MKKTWALATICGVLAVSTIAWAQGPGGRGGPGGPDGDRGGRGGFGFGWILHDADKAKQFGVTDEQIAILREDAYKHQQQMIKLRADLELARMEIDRATDQDKPDVAAIDKAIDSVSGIEAQIEKSRVHFMLQVREVLGTETMAKIKQAMHERHEGKDGKKGHGKGSRMERPECPQTPDAPNESPEN